MDTKKHARPHRCLSCSERFDEQKVNRFCVIGDKSVYFCKKCIDYPVDRLHVNTEAFTAKGFTSEELNQLTTNVSMYMR